MTKRKSNYNKSVYAPAPEADAIETHTLSILVDNQPGALAKIIGLFSGRGYNIDSLTVAETDHDHNLSRLTVVTSGAHMVLELIKTQLESLVQVREVHDFTNEGPFISRELALFKATGNEETLSQALEASNEYRMRVVDSTPDSLIFEFIGTSHKIDEIVKTLTPLGLTDTSRSGVAAISRGTKNKTETPL